MGQSSYGVKIETGNLKVAVARGRFLLACLPYYCTRVEMALTKRMLRVDVVILDGPVLTA